LYEDNIKIGPQTNFLSLFITAHNKQINLSTCKFAAYLYTSICVLGPTSFSSVGNYDWRGYMFIVYSNYLYESLFGTYSSPNSHFLEIEYHLPLLCY